MKISRLEDVVLSTLQTELLTDDHARLFAVEFNREVERLIREEASRSDDVADRLAGLDREIENLTANILAGVVSPTVVRMLADREAEAERLQGSASAGRAEPPKVLPHPTLRLHFECRVAALRESLSNPDDRAEVAPILQELVDEVVVYPANPATSVEIEVAASAARLIEFGKAGSRPLGKDQLSESAIKVVAGTRNTRCLRSDGTSFLNLVERKVPKLAA